MLRTVYNLCGKLIKISGYTTEDELRVLEIVEFQDLSEDDLRCLADDFIGKYTDYFEKYESITDAERTLLILKLRELAFGDDIPIKTKCPECKRAFETVLHTGDFYASPKKHIAGISFGVLSPGEKLYFKEENFENCDLDEYLEFIQNPEDYASRLKRTTPIKCPFCGHEININISRFKEVLLYLSEDSFLTLSEKIHTLVYFGRHTRSDILAMTPLERILEIQNFTKTTEKLKDMKEIKPL